MTRYYISDFEIKEQVNAESEHSKIEHYIVIFIFHSEVNFDLLYGTIKEYLIYNYAPTKLILVGSIQNRNELIKIKSDSISKLNTIPSTISFDHAENVTFWYFEKNGKVKELNSHLDQTHDQYVDNKLLEKIKTEGLIKIFRKRQAIIESTETHHFELPSGRHTDKFIRTGNILTNNAEISFIGFCVLPYLANNNIKRIYCDTASIIPIAQAAIFLIKSLDKDFLAPNIDSFGSYEGYPAYDFRERRDSLVLISTSRSGSLVKILSNKKKIPLSSFVSIFYLGKPKSDIGEIICSLLYDEENNSNGFPEIAEPFKRDECILCEQGSLAVKIESEQLLPSKVEIKSIIFEKTHSPLWLKQFIAQFRHSKIIKCHHLGREFFIDIEEIHKEINDFIFDDTKATKFKQYARLFEHNLKKHLPLSLNRIIYMNDPASRYMATQIKKYFETNGSVSLDRPEQFIQFTDDDQYEQEIKKTEKGATLVVGSCISTSRQLLTVSRTLRNFQNVSITYLVGVCRHYTQKAFDTLQMNVSYGSFGRHTYNLYWIEKIHLPDKITTPVSSWTIELELLDDMIANLALSDRNEVDDRKVLELLETRRKVLLPNNGLIEDLFWGKIAFQNSKYTSERLLLSKNFAFFDFLYEPQQIPQADVYFTISSIIHNLRYENKGNPLFIQNEYRRTLIDPHNFDRFNEGIIQASILRAARPAELHYSLSSSESEAMFKIIVSQIRNNGEAVIEFLLAIAIDKIRLQTKHIHDILQLIKNGNSNPLLKYFAVYIEEKNGRDEY